MVERILSHRGRKREIKLSRRLTGRRPSRGRRKKGWVGKSTKPDRKKECQREVFDEKSVAAIRRKRHATTIPKRKRLRARLICETCRRLEKEEGGLCLSKNGWLSRLGSGIKN